MSAVELGSACWCGSPDDRPFGGGYRACERCGTLRVDPFPSAPHFEVVDDATDFYGERYWTEYVPRVHGHPDLERRARQDLAERCLFWLDGVLARLAPPGEFLELGCAHGGFVRLLGEMGFRARGVELSPWVIDLARRRFGVEVLRGPLERLELPRESFAGIGAFDVLEHLRDPLGTVRRCRSLLRPDGVLFLQTPCYRDEGAGWAMLKPEEHVFLFNERALRLLLERAGFGAASVRPSLYPYDAWIVASPAELPAVRDLERIDLPPTLRALLDLRRALVDAEERLACRERDAAERLVAAESAGARLDRSEADRAARLAEIERLGRRLEDAEADRAARLAEIERLAGRLVETDVDREARGGQLEAAGARLAESEADRAARLAEMERLGALLAEGEADRLALLSENERLGARLRELAQRDGDARARIAALEADRRYRWLRRLGLVP